MKVDWAETALFVGSIMFIVVVFALSFEVVKAPESKDVLFLKIVVVFFGLVAVVSGARIAFRPPHQSRPPSGGLIP